MISCKRFCIVIMTFCLVGRFAESSEISTNYDDKIRVVLEASVPKHVNMGKIRFEYDFRSSCDNEDKHLGSPTYNNCRDVPTVNGSGVYNISINGRYKQLYCEVNPDGNNYLVIQRRVDGSLDFYRNWTEYENGFGNLNHEFWIGNKFLHEITSHSNYKLKIDLEAIDSTKAYAEYYVFSVGSPESKYKLNVSGYLGTAGDSLTYHSGQMFTTFDQDNDEHPTNCAVEFKGAWWYKSCHFSNLNGFYHGGHHESYADGVNWEKFKGYHESMKKATMKIY